MSNTTLIVVDFQNDYFPTFDGAKWPLDDAVAAAENGARLLAAFREKGLPIVHVRHEAVSNDAPFFWPNSEGAGIHPLTAPLETEPVVLKHLPNSFRQTSLKTILDEQGVESVVICGAMSNMCIDAITRAANDLGYACTVAHDACAACVLEFNGKAVPAAQVHAAYMASLAFGYAKVVSTDELMSEMTD